MISRVVRLLMLSMVATMGSFSIAAETQYQALSPHYYVTAYQTLVSPNSDKAAACQDILPFEPTYTFISVTGSTCTYLRSSVFNKTMSLSSVSQCAAPYSPTGLSDPSKACAYTPPDDDPCLSKQGSTTSYPVWVGDVSPTQKVAPAAPDTVCFSQCIANLTQAENNCRAYPYPPASEKFGKEAAYCDAVYTYDGAVCSGSESPLPPSQPPGDQPDLTPSPDMPNCPPGTYAVNGVCNSFDNPHPKPDDEGCPAGSQVGTVTVNGVPVPTCMKGGSSKPSSNSPGSGTAGATGADGAGGTSGNASAGSVGSTADTGGSVGGGGGGTQSQGVGTSEVGVVCDVQPVCEGDPLLCAIQIQEWKSSCELQKAIASPLPEEELEGWKQVGTTDIDSPEIDGTTARASQLLGQFSQRLGFSTAGCPGDFNISVLGRSVTIAISEICTLLRLMKMLLWLGAYLFSIRVLWSVIL